MENLVLTLLVALLTVQLASGQNVENRAMNDAKMSLDNNLAAQTRSIYGQRFTSPHQHMHFGKRPSEPLQSAAPGSRLFASPRVYDPPQPQQMNRLMAASNNNYKFPYSLTFELEHGQTLKALPEEMTAFEFGQPLVRSLYNFDQSEAGNSAVSKFMEHLEQESRNLMGTNGDAKFSKLINSNEADAAITGGLIEDPARQTTVASLGQQSDQDPTISVSTRSLNRANGLAFPHKPLISSLLFGRSTPTGLAGYGGYIKKAEPKENLFMHFGRK